MSTNRQKPPVSDHAILRWIERVHGSGVIAQARAEILADGRDSLIPRIRSGRINLNAVGATLVINNGSVVTVTKPERRGKPKAVRHG